MIILVCGGRRFRNMNVVNLYLDMVNAVYGVSLVVHGNAIGADSCADEWARTRHIDVDRYPADWKTHKNAAGPIRNSQMLREGKPELVVAFPGGKGTADMKRQTNKAGIALIDLDLEAHRRDLQGRYADTGKGFNRTAGH